MVQMRAYRVSAHPSKHINRDGKARRVGLNDNRSKLVSRCRRRFGGLGLGYGYCRAVG
jgi:hypothetical protein